MVDEQMSLIHIGGEKYLFEIQVERRSQDVSLRTVKRHNVGAMPSFLAFSKERGLALCIAEVDNTITSLRVNRDGQLEQVSQAACPGGPAYVAFDRSSRWALTASYGSGETRLFRIDDQGALAEAHVTLTTGQYSHCAVTTPNNQLIVVPSKGTDTLALIRFDAATGVTEQLPPVAAPEGSGPRHVVFSRDGRRAYVSGENDCSLIVYDIAGERFTQLNHLPSLPMGQKAGDTGSDVHLSSDERFIYVSNRGEDSISRFKATPGGADLIDNVPVGGEVPRNFCLLNDDELIVANQEGCSLSFFGRNPETGALTKTGDANFEERPFWVGNPTSY